MLVTKKDWNSIEGEIDTAIKNSRTGASKQDHSYLLTIKGMASGRGKKYEEAITKLSEAIKYDKQNSLAFLERGKILLTTGKNSKAITDLKKASSLGHKEAEEVLNGINN